MRIYFSFPIKENQETQSHIHHSFLNQEIDEVEAEIAEHTLGNVNIKVSNEILPYLMDGKAIADVCGLHGAYCVMCRASKDEGKRIESKESDCTSARAKAKETNR